MKFNQKIQFTDCSYSQFCFPWPKTKYFRIWQACSEIYTDACKGGGGLKGWNNGLKFRSGKVRLGWDILGLGRYLGWKEMCRCLVHFKLKLGYCSTNKNGGKWN